MNELQSVCRAAADLARLGEPALLATVVRVAGSTYRRPGARMLITPAGRRVGCVSGGCLEADVARRGWQLTESGRPALITYDATADADLQWGLGLGCNGVVRVLVERLPPSGETPARPLAVSPRGTGERPAAAADHLSLLDACAADRAACAVVLVFAVDGDAPVRPGTRLVLDEHGNLLLDGFPPDLREPARAAARQCLDARRSADHAFQTSTARIDALVEYVEPPPALLIVGGGVDAVPVAAAAKAVGWRVVVADRRARHLTPEHFPAADALVVCPPDEVARHVPIDGRTFAVVMNHSYPDDLAALGALLESPARYVGVLGPSHRREKLLHDLAEGGRRPTPAQLARLHAPVGLDVAAETPAEIAAAIVGELLAVRAARPAGFLRDCDGPIHDDVPSRTADAVTPVTPTPTAAGG